MADVALFPLSADEKLALSTALKRLINDDRYPLSSRVLTLTTILSRLEPPKAAPPPLPPRRHYEPPRRTPAQRRARR